MLKSYLKKITEIASRGDATEESYYSALEQLLKEYTESVSKRGVHVTILPKKTEAGNPDFRIWDGHQHIVGYIEAKSPTTEYLDQIETTDQLKRYLKTFPNIKKEERVYFNQGQYFEGIREEVWEYQVGGYQVCEKWLKDRKGRTLSHDDIKHYCKIVTSLQKTVKLQKAIDDIYPEAEKETINFKIS